MVKGARYHVTSLLKMFGEDRNVRTSFVRNLLRVRDFEWNSSRTTLEYNSAFEVGLEKLGWGRSIEEAITNIPRGRNSPLKILDNGAGKGVFLSMLKEKLNLAGIDSHVTAVSLHDVEHLKSLKKTSFIDEVVEVPSEFYIPKQKFHAIFDLFGGLTYTISEFRKDTLIKLALSLEKGGLMMVGFEYDFNPHQVSTITKGFSPKTKTRRSPSSYGSTLHIGEEMKGIERAFSKRGFEAHFIKLVGTGNKHGHLPNWSLLVKRLK